jgi:Ca2+-binding EF-hand superfamily protein
MNTARAREIFDNFDTNHNGSIEASELKEVFKQFDIQLSDERVDNMVILFYIKFGVVKFTAFKGLEL